MMREASIETLYRELDEWNYIGEEAIFWWRDDDAQTQTDQLVKLLALSDQYTVPLSLAVIPDGCTDALRDFILGRNVRVLQHGYAHTNHANQGSKKQELANRDLNVIKMELADGFAILSERFGEQFDAVLVPPWNRLDEQLIPHLPDIGLRGLSTNGPRLQMQALEDLFVVNVHVDIINWRDNKCFLGDEAIVHQIVAHLSDKRLGRADGLEPTGIMTHHLVHDDECWQFLEGLFRAMDEHPAVKWLDATRAFALNWR